MTPTDAGLWFYRARLVDTTDGDTARLEIDCGFGVRYEAAVRVAGIDAPPLNTPDGRAARMRLDGLLVGEGWPVRVRTLRSEADTEVRSFARWVARLWSEQPDGTLADVAATLVAEGHAVWVEA